MPTVKAHPWVCKTCLIHSQWLGIKRPLLMPCYTPGLALGATDIFIAIHHLVRHKKQVYANVTWRVCWDTFIWKEQSALGAQLWSHGNWTLQIAWILKLIPELLLPSWIGCKTFYSWKAIVTPISSEQSKRNCEIIIKIYPMLIEFFP